MARPRPRAPEPPAGRVSTSGSEPEPHGATGPSEVERSREVSSAPALAPAPPISLRRRLRRRYKHHKRALVFALVRALLSLVVLLPERAVRALGMAVGSVAGLLARADRARAERQLRAVWPELDAHRTTTAMFQHLGQTVAELALLSKDPGYLARWVELPAASRAALDGALADARGRGVVAVSAHLGNWELLPQCLVQAGYPVSTIARENANATLDQWIVALRARGGVTTIRRGAGSTTAREILRALKSGHLFALLVDQDTKVQSTLVPFFGRLAATPIAAAELALRSGRPVVVGFIRREGTRHVVTVERVPAVEGEDVTALTARLSARIEHHVRRAPEQWVWLHHRWNRTPERIDEP